MTREEMRAAATQVDLTSAPIWNGDEINPGDDIFGVVNDIRDVETKAGGTAKLMEVVTDYAPGLLGVWVSSWALSTWMKKAQVSIGDTVYIRFDEVKKLTGGKTVKLYSCNCEHAADFDPFGGKRPKTVTNEEIDPFANE